MVGRTFLSPDAPRDRIVDVGEPAHGDICRAAHGYAPTREAAMAAFVKK